MKAWTTIAAILLVGYLCLSRTFAYIGVPQWNAFIGEAALAALIVAGPGVAGRRWIWILPKFSALRKVGLAYLLFFGWGLTEVVHGIVAGYPPLTALRDLAFNYYPLYFVLGLWAGLHRPDLLPKLIRGFAWFNAVYGILFLTTLSRVEWFLPGVNEEVTPVPFFPQPIFSLVALLGLLAYGGSSLKTWCLLLLNAFVMLGMQFRTEWLAFVIGAGTLFLVMGHGKRLLAAAAMIAALLAVLYATDVTIPGPATRGGDTSFRQLTDRVTAPFSADPTSEATASGLGDSLSEESTFVWRTVWWMAIWDSVQESVSTRVWGFGYGYPLGELVPYLKDEFIRTPHNLFFYALGYSGWVGVAAVFAFQMEIFRLLRKSDTIAKDPVRLPFWAAMLTYSMFFPLGETPYGAIPFYLVLGWSCAPAIAGEFQQVLQKALHLRRASNAATPQLWPQLAE
jgi:hypothetical protein